MGKRSSEPVVVTTLPAAVTTSPAAVTTSPAVTVEPPKKKRTRKKKVVPAEPTIVEEAAAVVVPSLPKPTPACQLPTVPTIIEKPTEMRFYCLPCKAHQVCPIASVEVKKSKNNRNQVKGTCPVPACGKALYKFISKDLAVAMNA